MNDLIHYTYRPLTFVSGRRYQQNEPRTFGKPNGFWVSVPGEDDWPSWCQSEEFGLEALRFAHRVILNPDADILRITSVAELDAFYQNWSIETDYERRYRHGRDAWPIDWRQVARHYGGIIIAPYQYSRRCGADWYYGWDCASGCIWAPGAVAAVELISEFSEATQ